MQKRYGLIHKFFNLTLILSILWGNFSALAQTRRGSQAASQTISSNQTKQTTQKCSGAWTGVITYTRTQNQSDNKTVPRVSGRGEDTRDWQMKYDYKATVAV